MQLLTLIDLSSIFWQMWHATADLEVNETYRRTVDKVHALTSGSGHAAVCCDFPPYKRKEILATYKSQRDAPSEVAVEQLRRIKERLFEDGYPIWESPGYEADDIIASATRMAVERGMHVMIASGDKDLMQLVSDTVQVTSVQTGKVFDVEAVSETWGVAPELLGDVLALIGDKSDNVPGVPGVGPKWAAKLIATHGTLEDVLRMAPTIPGAVGRALQANTDVARLAARLIRLDDSAPVAFDECLQQRGPTMDAQEAEFTDTEAEPEPEPELAAQAANPTPAPPAQPVREPEPPGTALAIVPAQKWELQLEPTSSGGAVKLAKYLFESRLFGHLPNEQAVLAIILRGRSLGLDATTSLSNFHVIKGQPRMNAALLVGIVIRSGAAEYIEWTESDARHAVWVTKRKGNRREQSLKWTIDDALNACLVERHPNGLDGYRGSQAKDSNWDKYRATMLRWRCAVELCRSVYPDIVAGLWTPDEAEGSD